ncbi:serine hydrolase [Streptomyces sp. DH37]|uniref:serine hydrolase domain-containing protein n=1 Tax=Streptomyces sp. DH37 TaxID=3040122 RepID=UPI002442405A|nr:serine hydrolase [Streptomyces sp. DH37]MDG9702781.1 serine hydrolase [Streptomyces sp. DH37]
MTAATSPQPGPDPVSAAESAPDRCGLSLPLEAVAAAAPGPAVAVVAVRADESRLLCRGSSAATRFELGSVTKTFTALLLAEAAARGEVGVDDPIADHLPAAAVPEGYGGRITLAHLATHTSELPVLPPGLLFRAVPRLYTNPYETFTPDHLLRALSQTRVRRPPGTRVRYSNFGVGLLGRLLADAAGTTYERALAARVLEPLGLADSTCDPDLPQATGHWHGRPRPPWRIPGLPGAGALRSSARDLQRYLEVLLSPPPEAGDALRTALHDVTRPRVTAPGGDRMCLVWKTRTHDARDGGTFDLLFHSGGTRGFTSFTGFCPAARTGLAAVTNSSPTLRGAFIRTAYRTLRDLAAEAPARRV